VKGRKRHLLVDTLGLIAKAVVQPASVQDRDGARELLEKAKPGVPRMQHLWADAGYRATVSWIEQELGWTVEIVSRLTGTVGFAVQHRRWVVERTLAWLGKYRRLSKDYEWQTETSESWIYVAMAHILVRRLARA
jgi:putative transposase